MSRESEEVGRCEGCGRFKRWSDMGHMNPDGSLILCGDCSARHQKYPGPYPGPYSEMIQRLTGLAEQLGYVVDLYAFDLPGGVSGRIDYQARTIRLNEPSAGQAVATLAHEIGHALHAALRPDLEETLPKVVRERTADQFANLILKVLGPHQVDPTP